MSHLIRVPPALTPSSIGLSGLFGYPLTHTQTPHQCIHFSKDKFTNSYTEVQTVQSDLWTIFLSPVFEILSAIIKVVWHHWNTWILWQKITLAKQKHPLTCWKISHMRVKGKQKSRSDTSNKFIFLLQLTGQSWQEDPVKGIIYIIQPLPGSSWAYFMKQGILRL